MRRKWVQINLRLHEVHNGVAVVDGAEWVCSNGRWHPVDEVETPSYTILKDIEDFVSPVDGTHILGRASLREHNKRNEVTDYRDYTETRKKIQAEREAFRKGALPDAERREIIAKEVYRRS